MPVDLKAALQKLLAEIEDQETTEKNEAAAARLEALEGRKFTHADLVAAIKDASPEARAELRETLIDALEAEEGGEEDDEAKRKADEAKAAEAEAKRKAEEEAGGKKTKFRPGRKSGSVYDWTVDDETGKVVSLETAKVWNQPDEDDQVPLEEAS